METKTTMSVLHYCHGCDEPHTETAYGREPEHDYCPDCRPAPKPEYGDLHPHRF